MVLSITNGQTIVPVMARSAPRWESDPLIQECVQALRAVPFVHDAELQPRGPKDLAIIDARLLVRTREGGRPCVLPCVILRSHISRVLAGHFSLLAKTLPGLTLLAPTVGRDLGDEFEHEGVNFVDRAGNCSLRLDARHIARIQGRRAAAVAPGSRALRAPAYRALLALLVRPALISAPSRELAAIASVSPQTAADIRARLVERGIVFKTRKGMQWVFERRRDALDMFLSGYTSVLAPSLTVGRFRPAERDPQAFERRIEPLLDASYTWRYGGGAAAMRLTEYYRGERTTIYVQDPSTDLVLRLALVRDRNGPVTLLRSPGVAAFDSPRTRCVNPLIVYADLLAENDERAKEAAGEVYARYLAEGADNRA